jgi:hypothetical protein
VEGELTSVIWLCELQDETTLLFPAYRPGIRPFLSSCHVGVGLLLLTFQMQVGRLCVVRSRWTTSNTRWDSCPTAPFVFPSARGGCPEAHTGVPMVQALAKHIEQLVALPDGLRETTIRRFKKLCDSCGCHNEHELAEALADERRPRACPIAFLLRACGRLHMPVKLPACLFLGVAGRDLSWQALLMHLRCKASAPGADHSLVQDIRTVSQAWAAIRRHFRRRGVRAPRQLLLGHSFELVPESMSKNPAWLQPLRRALKVVEVKTFFPSLDRGEGVPEVAVHQQLLSEVIHSLRE